LQWPLTTLVGWSVTVSDACYDHPFGNLSIARQGVPFHFVLSEPPWPGRAAAAANLSNVIYADRSSSDITQKCREAGFDASASLAVVVLFIFERGGGRQSSGSRLTLGTLLGVLEVWVAPTEAT
jgi:hypothetical protein